MMKRALLLFLVASLTGLNASAQVPTPKEQTLHLEAALGSFKMINGTGTVNISFTGTVLLVNLKGKAVPKGNLRLEYDAQGRKAYFGTGTLEVRGRFRAIQWFGRNLKASWKGYGMVFVSGEFDDNLQLGTLWYDNETNRDTWYTGGRTLFLPDQRYKAPVPVPRGGTSG